MTLDDLAILACASGRPFAELMNQNLIDMVGLPRWRDSYVLPSREIWWPGDDQDQGKKGEGKTVIDTNTRGCHIVVVQDVINYQPFEDDSIENKNERRKKSKLVSISENDKIVALENAIDAAQRTAKQITVVIPYYPYSRQEKRTKDKNEGLLTEGITVKRIAERIEHAGNGKVTRVMTLDVHNEAIEPLHHQAEFLNVYASKDIIPYIHATYGFNDVVFAAADVGGAARAKFYSNITGLPLVFSYKEKDFSGSGGVDKTIIFGEPKGKRVFVVEDMIARGGTMESGVRAFRDAGASEVYWISSLSLLLGPAKERIEDLYKKGLLNGVIVTDSIFHGNYFDKHPDIYGCVPTSCTFAKAALRAHLGTSVSDMFKPKRILQNLNGYK